MMAFPKYESYQDSGVEWIREIPSHWKINRLKFLLRKPLKYGANEEATELNLDDPRYIRITDFGEDGKLKDDTFRSLSFDKAKEYLIEDGDILFARSGATVGKTFFFENYEGKACFAGYLIKASTNQNLILSNYLYLYTKSPLFDSWKGIIFSKSTIQNIGADKYNVLPVVIPPIEEQQRIIEFLDRKTSEIDQAIAKKQRLIELLQEQKVILINQAVTKGLNLNASMRDSGIEWLGEIPEHWEVNRLKRLFLEVDDRSTDGTETLLSLRMYEGLIPHDEVSDKPIQDSDLVGYRRVKPGELVMNRMRAAIGLFGVTSTLGIVSPDYAIFRKIAEIEVDYYLHLFKTDSMKTVFFLESKGIGTGSSGFLRLYSDRFGMIKVPVPPAEEQREILSYIQKINEEFSLAIEKVRYEIQLLEELKSIFIANAVTGKLKV